jgi:hypothetical protein
MQPVVDPGPDSRLLFGHHGPPPRISTIHRIRRKLPRLEDFILDRWIAIQTAAIERSPTYRSMPQLSILVVGVQSPRRPQSLSRIFHDMSSQRHRMTFDQKGVEGRGKLENINLLLDRHELRDFDWVWVVDDDVMVPGNFTDLFTAFAEAARLKIAGPAHRANSFASYPMTRRRHDSLVRQTSFVEVGPITAFRRETFDDLFPLPNLKFGWGLDLTWPKLAKDRGWRIGIVDATPIQHTSPVAQDYDSSAAVEEAIAYLSTDRFISREECWQTLHKWNSWPIDPGSY